MLIIVHGIESMVSDGTEFESLAVDILLPLETWFPCLYVDNNIYFTTFWLVQMRAGNFRKDFSEVELKTRVHIQVI